MNMKVLLSIFAILFVVSFAQVDPVNYECEAVGDFEDSICYMSGLWVVTEQTQLCDGTTLDLDTSCSKDAFAAYVALCPKRNSLQTFCGADYRCGHITHLNKQCTKDDDCKDPCQEADLENKKKPECYCRRHGDDEEVCKDEEGPEKECYESCLQCFSTETCDIKVEDGTVAKKGEKECWSQVFPPQEGEDEAKEDETSSTISVHQFGLVALVIIALFF